MRFSIFNVPFHRRMETLCCAITTLQGPIIIIISSWILLLPCMVNLRYLYFGYCLWAWFIDDAPTNGGRILPYYRDLPIFKIFSNYFPAKLIVTKQLDKKKKYILCMHPHGIIGMSFWPTLFTGAEDGPNRIGVDYRICTIRGNFYIPIYREFVMFFGFIDAGKKSFINALKKGLSVAIVVGGAREALLTNSTSKEIQLTLKRRKGFIRYAIQNDADLVPVFSFGESRLYRTYVIEKGSFLHKLQLGFLKITGCSPPLFIGRGIFNLDFGILPHRTKICTVMGESLELPHMSDPTPEIVDDMHNKYIEHLQKLFETHKDACGYKDHKLIICE